jgi:protein-disulfide isomerase
MKKLLIPTALLILNACTLPTPQPSQPPQTPQTGAILETESDGESPATAETLQPEHLTGSLLPERLLSSGLLELGNRDAPHTILLITEHHCGYCKEFLTEHIPTLEREFINPGNLQLTIAILPLKKYVGSTEMSAALLCAGKQGRGLPMHRLLFERTGSDRASLLSYARDIKIDEKLFGECLENAETAAMLDEQSSWLRSLGVSAVPTYFIDGKQYTGLPYAADLEGQIRSHLFP